MEESVAPPGAARLPEREAYTRLVRKYGRPARDRGRLGRWVRRQVEAIRAHLAAYPRSPHLFQLYQWLLTSEIDGLACYRQAEQDLAALEAAARDWRRPGAEQALLRARRLAVRLYGLWGRPREEAAAIGRLLPLSGGDEAALLRGRRRELTRLAPGCRAPEFEGRDLDGKLVSSRDLAGHVVLVDFWDAGHPLCAADFAERRRALDAFRAAGFIVVGVPLTRSLAAVKRWVAAAGATWPQLLDPRHPGSDHPVAVAFNVVAGPTSYLLDRRGVIRAKGLRGRVLLERLRELVGESVTR